MYRLPAAIIVKLKERTSGYVDIAHIISSHLRFDMIELYLMIEQKLKCSCVLIGLTFW